MRESLSVVGRERNIFIDCITSCAVRICSADGATNSRMWGRFGVNVKIICDHIINLNTVCIISSMHICMHWNAQQCNQKNRSFQCEQAKNHLCHGANLHDTMNWAVDEIGRPLDNTSYQCVWIFSCSRCPMLLLLCTKNEHVWSLYELMQAKKVSLRGKVRTTQHATLRQVSKQNILK